MRIEAPVGVRNIENRESRNNQAGEQVLAKTNSVGKTDSAENLTARIILDRQKTVDNKSEAIIKPPDLNTQDLPKAKSIVFWEPEPKVLTGTYTGPSAFPVPVTEASGESTGNPDLGAQKTDGPDLKSSDSGCQTCSNRKYQDGSDDMGVSFQMASHIDANASASVVMGHEREHERRETSDAEENGMKVVATRVRLKMSECPECHKTYASGGETEVLKTKDNDELLETFKNLHDPRYSDKVSEMAGKGTAIEANV